MIARIVETLWVIAAEDGRSVTTTGRGRSRCYARAGERRGAAPGYMLAHDGTLAG